MQVKHKVMSEGVLAWIGEQGLEGELGGPGGVLSMVLRALLVAGAKSFTHMITALERYCLVLQTLLAQAGAEVCWPSNSVPACNGDPRTSLQQEEPGCTAAWYEETSKTPCCPERLGVPLPSGQANSCHSATHPTCASSGRALFAL